jgi:hypothetical protein
LRTAATAAIAPAAAHNKSKKEKSFWENEWTIFSADNAQLVRKAQTFGDQVLNSKGIPSEETTMRAMRVIEFAAAQITRPVQKDPDTETGSSSTPVPSDGLLSLDSTKTAHPMSISISTELLSTLSYKIITHPTVFITPKMLASYVETQATLKRPSTFPEVFELYATKPAPVPNSDPIRYKSPNPDASQQAIPANVADKALDAAIESVDLSLALEIIETSYATRAFQRSKFLSKAAPGLGGLALAPAAALALATQLPQMANVPDPTQLTAVAFAGILTYVTSVSMIGFVAITTRNDQMERVTWVPGLALRERWLREDERAAADKVAMAWGFKEVERRGEEEGEEWETLKEWCGVRGMIVDRVELMDGME